MVRVLLGPGHADVSLRDRHLNTALHYAVKNKENGVPIVRELLNAHSDVNAENDGKETPEDLAAARKSRRNILKLFRQQPRTLVMGPSVGSKQPASSKP